jgi:hypothetical protein
MSQITPQQARENAQNDIADIEALAASQPFNRYFVRKLNELYKAAVTEALTGAKAKIRNRARHRANLLDELAAMPAKDRQACEKFLRTPDAQQRGPVQVG